MTTVIESATGGDAIVQALKAAGVEVAFGVISIHNIPIFDAIARLGGIRLVTTRGEAGAVNMADGYSRASGRLGVVLTSTGTGAGNAAGSLTEAQTAGSPVLHLTGQIVTASLDQGRGFIHEVRDQRSTLRGVSKRAYRLTHAAALPGLLRQAMQDALAAPRGPVSVELPIDLQSGPSTCLPAMSWRLPLPEPPAAADVEAGARLLSGSRRPVIFAGGGVIASGASAELTAVAERLQAPVLTSVTGRGAIPEDHPLALGAWAHHPALWPFLQSCDALLLVGSHARATDTAGWRAPLPARAVQIDADALALGRGYPAEVGIAADARLALAALLEALPARAPQAAVLAEGQAAMAKARAEVERLVEPYLPMVRRLRERLPRNALFVRDVTIAANTWGSRLFPIYEPRTNIFAVGGGIGQGLQMAIGAQLACPDRKVLCLAGDGGLMVNIGEMATAAQEGVPILLLLFNDGGFGVLRNIQAAQYGARHIGVDLRQPDFQALARAMGWQTWRVAQASDFDHAFDEALAAGGPALVEVDVPSIGHIAFGGPPAHK